MTSEIRQDALIKLVEDLANRNLAGGSQAQVTLINNTPSSWKVTIVAAAVKFFYRDGSDYTDGPRTINLTSGQSATFVSNDPDQCVFQYFLAMTVYIPKDGAKNMTFQDGVGDDECLIHASVTLGPKAAKISVDAHKAKATNVSDLLTVTSGSLKIESLDPSTVEVNWEGTLTINGRNFGEAGFVAIDGKEGKVRSWTSMKIEVDITKYITESAGSKRLVVHDANGNLDATVWTVKA